MENFDYIKRNYDSLAEEIRELSEHLGVKVPTLVAVTKSGSDDELLALARAGAVDIGENRPGEVERRGALLRAVGIQPRMHEIGTLQRNKIKLGDSAEMISPRKLGRAFGVTELYSESGEPIEAAPHPSQKFFVRVPFEVTAGDIIRSGE